MRTNLPPWISLFAAALLNGCAEKATATQSAQEGAAAKERADALKKEMQTQARVR